MALHIGTLAAIVTFFRAELAGMARAIPALLSADPGDSGRLMQLIVVGTIPIVIVGLLFTDFIEQRLRTPAVAAVALAVGALAMMVAERLGGRDAQRAGAALERRAAHRLRAGARSCPACRDRARPSRSACSSACGATRPRGSRSCWRFPRRSPPPARRALELRHIGLTEHMVTACSPSASSSPAIVGYLTIKYFLRFLAGHRLDVFAYYRLALAAATVVWLWRS